MTWVYQAPLIFVIALLSGCSTSPPPLSKAHPSAPAVAAAVVNAIAARDANALQALMLTEDEFRIHVWPELPAARPERNLPFSYVWGDLRQKSATSLQSLLAEHGGRRYVLSDVKFTGGVTEYPSYRVHREAVFVVRDSGGATRELRLCGSMFEKDGAWKVFSYVVDD